MAVDLDGKSFKIQSKFSLDCMELESNSKNDDTKLMQYPCNNNSVQKFKFTKHNNGFYTITAKSGKKLTLNSENYFLTQSLKGSMFKIQLLDDAYIIQEKQTQEYITANVRSGDIIKSQRNNQYSQMWYILK